MNINTTPHVLTRINDVRDLVYRVLHDDHGAIYYRPAVGDLFYNVDSEATLERIHLTALPAGDVTVTIYEHQIMQEYKNVDEAYAIFVAQHLKYLNPHAQIKIMYGRRAMQVVVPSTDTMIEYCIRCARDELTDEFIIDPILEATVQNIARNIEEDSWHPPQK